MKNRNEKENVEPKIIEAKEKTWKPFFKLLFRAKLPYFWIIVITVIMLTESTLTLLFPQYIEKIVGGNVQRAVVLGAVAVIVGRIVLTGVSRFITKITMYKIDRSYRNLIWKQLMRSPIKLYDKVKPNEMISRVTTDTSNISIIFSYIVPAFISVIYMTVGVIATLFTYDWRLGLAQAIFVPIYVGFYFWYGRWSYTVNRTVQSKLARLTQFLSELLQNIPLIKTFVTEPEEDVRGKKNIQSFYKASVNRGLITWIEHPMTGILGVIQSVLVIGLGVWLISNGSIELSQWVAYFIYVDLLYGVLATFGSMYVMLKESQGATARIAQIVEHPEEAYIRKQTLTNVEQDLVFDHVSFSYGKKKVFSDVSFTVPHGKVTAIVGPSGGGKTTILSLIQQFYAANPKSIRLGDTPIEDFHLKEWRDAFGYVAQDSTMLSGTIRENITYGIEHVVTDLELEEAALKANALKFINETPLGFDSDVGEGGGKLSGGQRQRIAIARVILRNPQFILLDEATSSLDTRSEKVVQEAMDNLMHGRTAIVIAHDLTTVRDADQIVVLDAGLVNGIGTHEQLMEENELYRLFVSLHTNSPTS